MNTALCDGIDWVGYIDWTVRDFHSYVTSRGATYNSYLIRDEKNALIDTVKRPYADYLLRNIAGFLPLEKLDYIVVNHAEIDHAGSLSLVVKAAPQVTLVCDAKCQNILKAYNPEAEGWNWQIVKSGDTLSLGKRTLTFLETPMVHWPESMMTYVVEEKILFSMDGFGQHYASSNRFDDEVDVSVALAEAKTYYANIVMLYGKQIQKTLAAASGLEINMIAPAHGVIWRSHIDKILSAYKEWVVCKSKPKVLVIYDTMWDSTKKMGEAMIDGATRKGVEAKLIWVRASGLTEVATDVLDAAVVAFGSSTLNQGMMPMMGAALTYLKGLKPMGKAGFAFGSYGWGKGGPEDVDAQLRTMNFEMLREPLKAQWRPTPEVLEECRAAGAMMAEKALAMVAVQS